MKKKEEKKEHKKHEMKEAMKLVSPKMKEHKKKK